MPPEPGHAPTEHQLSAAVTEDTELRHVTRTSSQTLRCDHRHVEPHMSADVRAHGCERRYVGARTGAGAQTHPTHRRELRYTEHRGGVRGSINVTTERRTNTLLCPETRERGQERKAEVGHTEAKLGLEPWACEPREQDPEFWNAQPGWGSDGGTGPE